MGIVTIRCPATGEEVPTGVVIDAESFALLSFHNQVFRCDACSAVHVWDKTEAMFKPGDGPGSAS